MTTVPNGVERLLRLASVDEAFRKELIARRSRIASATHIDLSRSERAILDAIDEDQLHEMCRQLPPPQPARRKFLRQAATAALLVLGGAVLADAADVLGSGESATRVMGCGPPFPMAGCGDCGDDYYDDDSASYGDDDDSAE
jgi:hypothetical protein